MSSVADVSSRRAAPALGAFERYLTLWVALCIIAGVLLGMFLGVSSYSVGPLTASSKPRIPISSATATCCAACWRAAATASRSSIWRAGCNS